MRATKQPITYTALEKLIILEEVEDESGVTSQKETLHKYAVDSATLCRWRRMRRKLEKAVADGEQQSKKKIFRQNHLWRVEEAVDVYMEELSAQSNIKVQDKYIQMVAIISKYHLLLKHADEPFLSKDEENAIRSFKASIRWCGNKRKSYRSPGCSSSSEVQTKKKRRRNPATLTINGEAQKDVGTLYYNPDEMNETTKWV